MISAGFDEEGERAFAAGAFERGGALLSFSTAALAIERHHLGRTPFLAPDIGHKHAVAASQATERVRSDPGCSRLISAGPYEAWEYANVYTS